jgi:hypothetical protein
MIDITVAPIVGHSLVPQLLRARQLNYQVPLFVGTLPNNHVNMMLPKFDVFRILRNNGTSMDVEVKHWNMIVHGYGSEVRIQDDAASEDFRTLKPP